MPAVERFWHPVLASARLRKRPVRVVLDGRAYALFRDHHGRAGAVADACPHRLAPLSMGSVRLDGRLACGYHGWHFDRDGNGVAPSFANKRCTTRALEVCERHGYVWIAQHGTALASLPELETEGFTFSGTASTRFEVPLHVALDNFSENEHVPWVHQILGWDEAGVHDVDFCCENHADRSVVQYRGPQRAHPLLPLLGAQPGDTFHNDWETRFDPVRTTYTLTWFAQDTGAPRPLSARFVIFMLPETEKTTVFQSFLFTKIQGGWHHYAQPLVRRAVLLLGKREIAADAKFVAARLADAPLEMRGMHPSPWDKPVVHNRKLLQRAYRGLALRTLAGDSASSEPMA